MAPLTRAKLAQASEPATPTKASSTKTTKSKSQATSKLASISTVSHGSVQKSKKSKGKGKKPASKASSNLITIRSSSEASRSKSKAVPPIALDDFPELAQAYTIMPYLDSPEFNVPYASSRGSLQRPATPPFANVRSLRADSGLSAPSSYRTKTKPIFQPRVPSVATRPSSKRSNSGSVQSGKRSDWAKAARVASPRPTLREQARSLSKRSKSKKKAPAARSKQKIISLLSSEPSASSPSSGEAQQPETLVSVKNSQVFKRPTVEDVRHGRMDLVDLLSYWAEMMQRSRDETDALFDHISERVGIIEAMNRVQGPLRRAPLGRGRARVK